MLGARSAFLCPKSEVLFLVGLVSSAALLPGSIESHQLVVKVRNERYVIVKSEVICVHTTTVREAARRVLSADR